eukprot:CAMPEP_0174698488 /NCGR_PEP_ID=MMETSP1094-20130205/4078_1 /TAXON_ID=156173 /ORGANISM="Chrysochromulina brevifilum, Strain UTEX LB 985" /LENGTH=260 /DNA_ID=CAMNT_0015895677 /DNA_START=39 /DNA_END=821 /DNA_ORIENTATION=+
MEHPAPRQKLRLGFWATSRLAWAAALGFGLPFPTACTSWTLDVPKADYLSALKLICGELHRKQYMGFSPCRLCDNKFNGGDEFHGVINGVEVTIPSGYFHYVAEHNVHPLRSELQLVMSLSASISAGTHTKSLLPEQLKVMREKLAAYIKQRQELRQWTFDTFDSDTVEALKTRVGTKHGLDIEQFWLYDGGRKLEDSESVPSNKNPSAGPVSLGLVSRVAKNRLIRIVKADPASGQMQSSSQAQGVGEEQGEREEQEII